MAVKNFVPGRFRTPLVLQILSLLFTGLVVAQLVTLLLTLLMPPATPAHHELNDIAAALRGEQQNSAVVPLDRTIQRGPPDVSGHGWLVSEQARIDLAAMLKVPTADVSLAFFTPLPFAGTAASPKLSSLSDDNGFDSLFGFVGTAYAQTPPTLPQPMLPPPGTTPGNRPPGHFPGAGEGPDGGRRFGRNPDRPGTEPAPGVRGHPGNNGLFDIDVPPTSTSPIIIPGDGGGAVPPIFGQRPHFGERSLPAPVMREMTGPAPLLAPLASVPIDTTKLTILPPEPRLAPVLAPAPAPALVVTAVPPVVRVPEVALPTPVMQPAAPIMTPAVTRPSEPAVPLNHTQTGLFGTAPAPFVEGDFVAAWRVGPGRWIVVQPRAEAFPNAWQRRVLLWFSLSFVLVLPLGWLFARRIVKPLSAFAHAAEQLGRDPAPVMLEINGPAEVGRAAHAFNVMQARLKSFVDDRTAMVGAISHDLRTPLTRLRFRIEEVDEESWRDGMTEEVVEMEAMISSVLAFIRDASTPGARERVDLRTILEDVVGSANRTGSVVTLETTQAALVDVDPLAMRRIFGNLIDNATKYGGGARIRLSVNADEALAEVIDNGPGIPDDEIEQAFKPFYRSLAARNSLQQGSGLGLAVCRSIARAHGGDVRLVHSSDGFTARLNVPLAFAA